MRKNSRDIARYYRDMNIMTASEWKQIVLLHSRLGELIREVRSQTQTVSRRMKLNQGQNILAQLETALRTEEENELIHRLFLLYDYLYTRLERAEDQDLADAQEITQTLTETFEELLKRK
ncbi:MAG: flagellar protein FliS [Fibrobacterota bacterium]